MSREGCFLELECSIILSQIEINGQNLLYDENAVVCQNISIHISVYKICKNIAVTNLQTGPYTNV